MRETAIDEQTLVPSVQEVPRLTIKTHRAALCSRTTNADVASQWLLRIALEMKGFWLCVYRGRCSGNDRKVVANTCAAADGFSALFES